VERGRRRRSRDDDGDLRSATTQLVMMVLVRHELVLLRKVGVVVGLLVRLVLVR